RLPIRSRSRRVLWSWTFGTTHYSSTGSTSRQRMWTKQPERSSLLSKSIWRKSLAEVTLRIAMALIFFAILFGVIRLVIGKTLIDRVVAIDMLTVISISLISLYAQASGRFVYIDVALVYGLLSFLAVLAIARFLERGL